MVGTLTENLLLAMKLAAAMPAEVERMSRTPGHAGGAVVQAARVYVARNVNRLLHEIGDGGTEEDYTRLGRCLAVLACQPGGVTPAGMHWEAQ